MISNHYNNNIYLQYCFSLTYRKLGFVDKLPVGVYTPHQIHQNMTHLASAFKMHSALILGHGYDFIDTSHNGVRHTDYRLEVVSKNLFVEAVRNRGGEYFYYFIYLVYFYRV